jgi:predicted DNA-binding transcriptional regulator YafY
VKIDRLVSIIMVLLDKDKVSASKLANMFEVTPRTIYRDIETLQLAGIPIVTSTGANGGISIMSRYKVDNTLFTAADLTALLKGLSAISPTLSGQESANALAKLKSLIPATYSKDIELKSNQIVIDLSRWIDNSARSANLETVKLALEQQRLLNFDYFDCGGNKSIRQVEPYQLVLKESQWYLQGFCLSRQDSRIFKLARMLSLNLGEAFTPREFNPKPLNGADWIDTRLIKVCLLVDHSLKESMIDSYGPHSVESYDERRVLVHFPFIEDDVGYGILLGYGTRCECISPLHVRNELIRRLEMLLALYRQN